jgi:hypothetical protein
VVQQTLDDSAPEKAGSAENRDQSALAGCTAASLLVNGALNSSARITALGLVLRAEEVSRLLGAPPEPLRSAAAVILA